MGGPTQQGRVPGLCSSQPLPPQHVGPRPSPTRNSTQGTPQQLIKWGPCSWPPELAVWANSLEALRRNRGPGPTSLLHARSALPCHCNPAPVQRGFPGRQEQWREDGHTRALLPSSGPLSLCCPAARRPCCWPYRALARVSRCTGNSAAHAAGASDAGRGAAQSLRGRLPELRPAGSCAGRESPGSRCRQLVASSEQLPLGAGALPMHLGTPRPSQDQRSLQGGLPHAPHSAGHLGLRGLLCGGNGGQGPRARPGPILHHLSHAPICMCIRVGAAAAAALQLTSLPWAWWVQGVWPAGPMHGARRPS